jgi:hypothetical protein
VGELGVFFPTDGQLSDEFCTNNNLYPVFDEKGKRTGGGFIDPKNRRVRAQTFRGVKSYGFWMPISCASYTGVDLSALTPGMAFCDLNEHQVCNKYVTAATSSSMSQTGKRVKRGATPTFPKHVDTDQFKYYYETIPTGSKITITLKVHGTSQRSGYCFEPIKNKWWKKPIIGLCRLFGVSVKMADWQYLNGTRNVILEHTDEAGFYGTNDFREKAFHRFSQLLKKGEVVYYELVGWVDENTTIMSSVSTSALGKEFVKKYGETMVYKYGCVPGTCEIYVYRIAQFNEDGEAIELSWEQVKQRCSELGLNHVPEIDQLYYEPGSDPAKLRHIVESYTSGVDLIDPGHIREGVVVRIDHKGKTQFLKNKSFDFLVLEGVIKENETTVDIEEAA